MKGDLSSHLSVSLCQLRNLIMFQNIRPIPLAFLIIKKNFLQEECWNDLPKEVINATSTDDFKNLIDFYMTSSTGCMYTFDL